MPVPRKAVERDGQVFGLPITVMGEVTFANLDALRKAGVEIPDDEDVTWEWMVEQAPAFPAAPGIPTPPQIMPFPSSSRSYCCDNGASSFSTIFIIRTAR